MARLTARQVGQAAYDGRDRVLWDDLTGFGVRIRKRSKSYIVQYRHEGKLRRVTLGRVDFLPLAAARKKAHEMLGRVAAGEDPTAPKRTDSLEVFAREVWFPQKVKPNRKPSTAAEYWRLCDKTILPALGRRKLGEIRRRDVVEFHGSLHDRPTLANRCLAVLSSILTYAESLEEIDANPCRRVERYPERSRDRHLSIAELGRLGEALEDRRHAELIRLLALTGCRRDEIRTLRWAQVDWERRLLVLEETKTGPRLKALGDEALELLRHRQSREGSEWVFPSARSEGPVRDIRRAIFDTFEDAEIEDATPHHVFRHTFTTQAAELGIPDMVIAAMVGHSVGTMTSKYAHLSVDRIVRDAEERVQSVIAGALDGHPPGELVALGGTRAPAAESRS